MCSGPAQSGTTPQAGRRRKLFVDAGQEMEKGGILQYVAHFEGLLVLVNRRLPGGDLLIKIPDGDPYQTITKIDRRRRNRHQEWWPCSTVALDRSQNATGSQKHRDPRFAPYAFTEHGAIMAATILSSPRAVEMSVYVVRAFVQLREMLASNKELARRFAQLETRLDKKLTIHDEAIAAILSAIRQLMHPPVPKRRPIGFTADLREKV